jgi:ADP-heptose:LPS heptosyltransferase
MGRKKLVLRCGFSPGDIVMLTAAVRDLHLRYPGRFITDVRTACPEIWENNPLISRLDDDDPEVQQLECTYPLIDRCSHTPYHCLHGFIEFLNERLNLAIKPTVFKGDIHLSDQEKAWYSQIHEVTRKDIPFWIVAAGGKYDVTIKWWETSRYQEVINHFRGKILFVQIGTHGHHHPKLEGTIDLRGQTTLRELIRLVYHAQGVLCPVTGVMHLAAAVETKGGGSKKRPCVVVAGGREPAHWEAYPDHQFIHNNGALSCGLNGGCWKDRTFVLRDGDERDNRDHLCSNVVGNLPRCMDMVTPAEVIRRIELYFEGGMLNYLSSGQRAAAERGIKNTQSNSYDQEALNIHNAGMACDRFIKQIPAYPGKFLGRGIVICGGGVKYFTSAWVCIHMLRRLGCKLPIQVWYLGEKEMDEEMKALLTPHGVECIDAVKVRKLHPVRILNGWELKTYAIIHSSFREVLLLDADNVPLVDPEFLFDTPQYQETGAIFWPDYDMGRNERVKAIWKSCGLLQPKEPEFESGQIVVDKERCWAALSVCKWLNENSDFYYQYIHGDKETFHLAFRKVAKKYALVPKPVYPLQGTMCQHDFEGRRIFQHRNSYKWDLFPLNKRIKGFLYEEECLEFLDDLRNVWDGRSGEFTKETAQVSRRSRLKSRTDIEVVMISCEERKRYRKQSLQKLVRTDWEGYPVHVQIEKPQVGSIQERETAAAYLALKESLRRKSDYILLLEDDVECNLHLRHNLINWAPLQSGAAEVAVLCSSGVREFACDIRNNFRVLESHYIIDSAAFLFSRETARGLVKHWNELEGRWNCRVSFLAEQLSKQILCHAPSLVRRTMRKSIQGKVPRQAIDFDPEWKAHAFVQ